MKREDLSELHYIAPVANVASILAQGILSHAAAESLPHVSVADTDVQQRRATNVSVLPGGLALHQYVNLYFTARNPMLFRLMRENKDVCVLRVNPDVLDLPGVVISTANAAGEFAEFALAPAGLRSVNHDSGSVNYRSSKRSARRG